MKVTAVISVALAVLCAAAAAQQLAFHHHDAAHQALGTIVVPASDFYANIPEGDSNDGRFPTGAWFFNNNTINLGSSAEVVADVPVKEAGVYQLFVRSIGTPGSSFHVRVAGKTDPGTYGDGPLSWKRGGDFTLKPGTVEVRLTSIHPVPSPNGLVLTENADLQEDDLKSMELPPE